MVEKGANAIKISYHAWIYAYAWKNVPAFSNEYAITKFLLYYLLSFNKYVIIRSL